jgi:hypothetical protein
MGYQFNPLTGKLDQTGSGATYTAPANVTSLAFSELFSSKLNGDISGTNTQTGQTWVVSTPTASNLINTNGSATLSNWTTATGSPRAYPSVTLPANPVRLGGLFSFNAGSGIHHAQFVLLAQPSNTDYNSCLHCGISPGGLTLQYNSSTTGGLSFVTVGSVTFPTPLRLDGTLYVFEIQLVGTTLSCKYGDPLDPSTYSVTDANLAGKGGVTATYEPFAAGTPVASTLNLHALWAGSDADKSITDTLNDVINNAARASGRTDFVRTESALGRLISGLGSKAQTLGILGLNDAVKTSGSNVMENGSSITFNSNPTSQNPPTGAVFYDAYGNANRKYARLSASGDIFAVTKIADTGNYVVGGDLIYMSTSAPNGSFLTYNATWQTFGMQSLAAGTGISINTAWNGQNTLSVSPLVSLDNIDNNFTAGQTITAQANSSALTASYSVTGANTTAIVNLSGTWNTTGVARGILLNVTDTASNAGSLLADFRVGGTSRFSVDKGGSVTNTGAIISRFDAVGSNALVLGVAGFERFIVDGTSGSSSSVRLPQGGAYTWTSAYAGGTRDLFLTRDAANTLALRNGTNAQAFRLYGTFTDASNFERGFMRWNSNTLEIGTEAGGTGTARATRISSASFAEINVPAGQYLNVNINNANRFGVGGTGNISYSNLIVNSGANLRLAGSVTPASATATGTTGDIQRDADYIYVCTATNTWKRAALSTW